MSIGHLSQRTGVAIETIRYYEKIALLPPPARSPSGYRQYEASHVRRLLFVRRGRDLGFSVESIRALLALADRPDLPCGDADRLVASHLAEVEKKIADLIGLRGELRQMINCCGQVVAECKVIDSFASGDSFALGHRRIEGEL
jgi:MerR family transcriptional regulator, mercuric resistance operon regulatory protein